MAGTSNQKGDAPIPAAPGAGEGVRADARFPVQHDVRQPEWSRPWSVDGEPQYGAVVEARIGCNVVDGVYVRHAQVTVASKRQRHRRTHTASDRTAPRLNSFRRIT